MIKYITNNNKTNFKIFRIMQVIFGNCDPYNQKLNNTINAVISERGVAGKTIS